MSHGPMLLRLFFLAGCLAVAGCGKDEPTGANTPLTEKEKQQIQELNQQRQSEWGSPKSRRQK